MHTRDLLFLQDQEYALALAADIKAEEEMRRSIEATLLDTTREEDAALEAEEEEEEEAPALTLEQLREARLRALLQRPVPRRRPRRILNGIDAANIVTSRRQRGV